MQRQCMYAEAGPANDAGNNLSERDIVVKVRQRSTILSEDGHEIRIRLAHTVCEASVKCVGATVATCSAYPSVPGPCSNTPSTLK